MRFLPLLVLTVFAAAIWVSRVAGQSPAELPPRLQRSLEQAQKDSHEALNGPRGDEARRVCMRIAGVSFPARTGLELIRAGYSSDVAIKYTDCVVNYLFPVDAKNR